MKGKYEGIRITLVAAPLCLSLLATALVFQNAFGLRLASVPDDGLLPPVTGFISPAAVCFLLAGYAVSLVSIAVFAMAAARDRKRDHNADHDPDEDTEL